MPEPYNRKDTLQKVFVIHEIGWFGAAATSDRAHEQRDLESLEFERAVVISRSRIPCRYAYGGVRRAGQVNCYPTVQQPGRPEEVSTLSRPDFADNASKCPRRIECHGAHPVRSRR